MANDRRSRSKILRLPREIVEAVNRQLVEGYTYDEIVEFINSMGHSVSRSSVGRYGQRFLKKLERLQIAKEQATTIVEKMGGAPATEMHEAANQLAVQLIMDTLMQLDDLSGEKVSELLKALAQLERSAASREKLKLEFQRRADQAVSAIRDEEVAGKSPAELRELIRQKIREEYGG